ncbi:MAG: T9SS type A sorting domain-containing protein [Candidatus Sabulitectum sp.]|nr:T9SS type A sorting domain-containing protein [Candidatus Sabulitectum sp.]
MLQLLLTLYLAVFSTPNADFLDFQDDHSFGSNLLYFGPQLAVDKVTFRRPSGTLSTNVTLGAISLGDNDIAIFELDFSTPQICNVETITFPDNSMDYDYFTFDATFMQLPISGTAEWCLVVPIVERSAVANPGTPNNGNIMIVRLETRDANHELVTINSGFVLAQGVSYTPEEVYYCTKNPDNGDYLVSFAGGGENVVCISSFNQIRNRFEGNSVFELPDLYFAHNDNEVPRRPYEHFYFDEVNDYAYLTSHNGGITLWDYSTTSGTNLPIESSIAAQQGGWASSSSSNGGELGDAHRGAVLECDEGPNSDSKLLFFANLTMGIMVYDVTDPENPLFVFQWDDDTKPSDWTTWHGAGAGSVSSGSEIPAVTFGLDVCGYEGSPDYIHLYAGNGVDGLRTIDFSEFLVPWGGGDQFLALDEHTYFPQTIGMTDYWAHDLRTIQHGTSLYVITSWREPPDSGNHYGTSESGVIAITLHKDDTLVLPSLDYSAHSSNSCDLLEPLHFSATNSPNPASDSQILSVFVNRDSACLVQAYDISGRLVRNSEINLNEGSNNIVWTELPGDRLPSGSYILKITSSSGEEVINKSIIIN